MENYTHVDGIYTANPSVVAEARKIDELSYADAAELSQFGAEILHIKTIEPLQEQGIPLRVLNTFSYGEVSMGRSSRPIHGIRSCVRWLRSRVRHSSTLRGATCLGARGSMHASSARSRQLR